MDTKEQIEIDLKGAIKARDDVRKRTLRMALAAMRQIEIDKQVKLDETAEMAIIQKEIKTRRDTVEEARRINRQDVIADTEAEISVLQAYLPPALSTEELKALVGTIIAEVGASSPADIGKVMRVLMTRVAGRAPGDLVNATVRQLLQKQTQG
jgi:uncharacterized protein YqeY